jgi:hypothetical protein
MLGFDSLASTLVEAQRGWCTWHDHVGHMELKLKMVTPMLSGAA